MGSFIFYFLASSLVLCYPAFMARPLRIEYPGALYEDRGDVIKKL